MNELSPHEHDPAADASYRDPAFADAERYSDDVDVSTIGFEDETRVDPTPYTTETYLEPLTVDPTPIVSPPEGNNKQPAHTEGTAAEAPDLTEPIAVERAAAPRDTIGAAIVEAIELAYYYELQADLAGRRIEYAKVLERTKVHPDEIRAGSTHGESSKAVMTPEDMALIHQARNRDSENITLKQDTARTEREWVGTMLDISIRRKFSMADQIAQRDAIEAHIDTHIPEFFKRISQDYRDQGHSWADWLANDASDDQLINFLQWNVDWNTQLQKNTDFTNAVKQQREHYKEAVTDLVDDDWFSAETVERLAKVDDVTVMIGDPLSTMIRGVRGSALLGEIIIKLPNEGKKGIVAEVLPHEFNHEVIQQTKDTELDERWILEALTEASARLIRPDSPSAGYPDEQLLLARLLQNGAQPVDVKLATRAYSGGLAEKQLFYDELAAAWGVPNVLSQISAFIRRTENFFAQDGVSNANTHQNQQDAVYITAQALVKNPTLIFGDTYRKPSSA